MLRWVAIAAALLAVPPPASPQSGRGLLREGNRLYDGGEFSEAEIRYRKALENEADSLVAAFNLGDALYRQGRHEEAARQYAAATQASDGGIRSDAYHNLGNALLEGGKVAESIEAYKEALRIDPADEDTRYNLEYARRLLQQQQEQQQQDQNEQDKQDQKDKQDRQNRQEQENQQDRQQQNQEQQPQDRQPKEDRSREGREPERPDQISKEDAERILEALRKQEQDVKKKLQAKVPARIRVERDW